MRKENKNVLLFALTLLFGVLLVAMLVIVIPHYLGILEGLDHL